jgi:hypothetical protein
MDQKVWEREARMGTIVHTWVSNMFCCINLCDESKYRPLVVKCLDNNHYPYYGNESYIVATF